VVTYKKKLTIYEVKKLLTKEELPFCPVATTVDLIGNKWKLLIMRELLTGTKRFNEMHRLVDGISQKVLTENLRKMESDGIVKREVFPEVPPRVEYSLTDLGDSLRPIINSMSDWGTDYIKNNLLEQK
jgi:DNA-binding HxlR family transcriptional regulator